MSSPDRPQRKPRQSTPDEILRAAREERWEARRLPLMFTAVLGLVLVSRLDALRGVAGVGFGMGFPVLCAGLAVRPFRDVTLWVPALVLALLLAAASVAQLSVVFAPDTAAAKVLLGVLALAPVAGAALQARGALAGVRSFAAAWFGIGALFSYYFADHRSAGHDAMDAVLAAGLVSLFVGGGVGFALGAIATAIARRLQR
ncbi:MAG: hypothetical protein R3B13_35390 [Polyangiaceae bacterium]